MAAMLPTGIGQTHRRTWHHQDMTIETEQRAAAQELAAWTSSLDLADVPAEVRAVARDHILDALGCGLAALGVGEALAGLAVAEDAGSGPASAIGRADRVPAAAAALANGMLCHGLDFDDTHEASIAHVATVVVPAAIAVAEAVGATGAQTLAAIVAATETVTRIGMAAPEGFHRRGFHPTGVCGVFGATVAACRLRGMDAETTTRALGLAGSMASGIFEYLADGSPTKPFHAGWAAQAGVQAAALAAAGARGPSTVLEGRYGLLATHVDVAHDMGAQIADLGERWESPLVAIKPYPACHWIHAAVDAAVEATGDLAPGEIDRIVVRIPEVGEPIVLEPLAQKRTPVTEYDAKFSLPWCVAARIVHGRLDVRSFVGDIADPAVLALAAKVEYEPWQGDFASVFAGGARVEARGTSRAVVNDAPRGAPGNPMTHDDIVAKFTANATLSLPAEAAGRIAAAVDGLDDAADVAAITADLRSAAA
jgi:2-methylcitrate dehydratase PrpD